MKFIVFILFAAFSLQNDTTKVDTVSSAKIIIKQQQIEKTINNMNHNLDSLIATLKKDTIK